MEEDTEKAASPSARSLKPEMSLNGSTNVAQCLSASTAEQSSPCPGKHIPSIGREKAPLVLNRKHADEAEACACCCKPRSRAIEDPKFSPYFTCRNHRAFRCCSFAHCVLSRGDHATCAQSAQDFASNMPLRHGGARHHAPSGVRLERCLLQAQLEILRTPSRTHQMACLERVRLPERHHGLVRCEANSRV